MLRAEGAGPPNLFCAIGSRLVDKSAKEREVRRFVCQRFRMPLDTQPKAIVLQLTGFDSSILRTGADSHTLSRRLNGLVVGTIGFEGPRADDVLKQCSRFHVDKVACGRWVLATPVDDARACLTRDILD